MGEDERQKYLAQFDKDRTSIGSHKPVREAYFFRRVINLSHPAGMGDAQRIKDLAIPSLEFLQQLFVTDRPGRRQTMDDKPKQSAGGNRNEKKAGKQPRHRGPNQACGFW